MYNIVLSRRTLHLLTALAYLLTSIRWPLMICPTLFKGCVYIFFFVERRQDSGTDRNACTAKPCAQREEAARFLFGLCWTGLIVFVFQMDVTALGIAIPVSTWARRPHTCKLSLTLYN